MAAYKDHVNDLELLSLPIDYFFQRAMRENVVLGYSLFPQIIVQHRTGSGIKSDLRPDEVVEQPKIANSALNNIKDSVG